MTTIPLILDFKGRELKGTAIPLEETITDGVPTAYAINLGEEYIGVIHCHPGGWKMDTDQDPEMVDAIGGFLHNWSE
ncbi:MAG: hypothetical protein M3413_14075 [Bacteroidota bacterium]|jgi:hypothetical protein|nr:hypothetical protein [Bacteroidota bacterium]